MGEILLFCGVDHHIDKYVRYMEAVNAVGLVGRYVPPGPFDKQVQNLISTCSGVVLCGGGDIDPDLYAPGEPNLSDGISRERDLLEKEAIPLILETDLPLLAICRGFQVLNWVLGGDLYQDLPAQFESQDPAVFHQQRKWQIPENTPVHEVSLEPGSLISSITGRTSLQVNSTHHQGLKSIAKALAVTGKSPDGLVEAVEMPGKKFLLAVQFHPEKMIKDDESMLAIFRAFARAVKDRG
jgi:putative glutamine amidotransferase